MSNKSVVGIEDVYYILESTNLQGVTTYVSSYGHSVVNNISAFRVTTTPYVKSALKLRVSYETIYTIVRDILGNPEVNINSLNTNYRFTLVAFPKTVDWAKEVEKLRKS